jgi:hypothetical protein
MGNFNPKPFHVADHEIKHILAVKRAVALTNERNFVLFGSLEAT